MGNRDENRFQRIQKFVVLNRISKTLQNNPDLARMTKDDFSRILTLIEECTELAKISQERAVLRRVMPLYKKCVLEWQKIKQEEKSDNRGNVAPELDFDSKLTAEDRHLLARHHQAIAQRTFRDRSE